MSNSTNPKRPKPQAGTPLLPLAPQPKVRTKAQQERYEHVTARNRALATREGPCPAIYA